MSALIERIAELISPLVRCADVNFPHGLEWDGEDEAGSLMPEERHERREIVVAVLAELDAAGYAIVPKEPTYETQEARRVEELNGVVWVCGITGKRLRSFSPPSTKVTK